jgi:hypothetical protein
MKRHHFFLACWLFLQLPLGVLADNFGAISVVPQAITSGDTYHGYKEFRILLENRSIEDTHRVRLVYPERSFNYGNSIGRITRQVTLAAQTRAAVPIWQPPLPQSGSGQMRVFVDDEDVGTVSIPGNSHMSRAGAHYGGALTPATVLVSRSVNFDELAKALQVDNRGFSAAMAVNGPDSPRSRGVPVPTAWSPDPSRSPPHWLELDYSSPIRAERIRLFDTMGAAYPVEIVLTGISGTNLPPVTAPSFVPHGGTRYPPIPREITFPPTPEPIKTVRLNFGST